MKLLPACVLPALFQTKGHTDCPNLSTYGRQNKDQPPKTSMSSSHKLGQPMNMLLGKGESRLQTELRVLISWLWDGKIILDYLDRPKVITSGDRGRRVRVMWCEKKSTDHWCPPMKMEKEDDDQRMQAASRSCKRWENGLAPRASRNEYSPADPMIFAQCDPFSTSHLQSCKIINLCCLSH